MTITAQVMSATAPPDQHALKVLVAPSKFICALLVILVLAVCAGQLKAAPRVQDPNDWKWSDVLDPTELTILQSIKSQWNLPWDFSQSWAFQNLGIMMTGVAYHIVYDVNLEFLGYDLDEAGHIDSLILDHQGLTGSIPATMSALSKLTALALSINQLSGPIPATLGNLSQLQYLLLDHNQLSGAIPATLGNLAHLQYLFLWENQLNGAIPATLGNLSQLKGLLIRPRHRLHSEP